MDESDPSERKLMVVSAEQSGDVLISLAPPREPLADKNARALVDICCVVDVSGSMGKAAMPDEGLSILDVVRHALRTIMATLGPQDRMAVVAFTDCAYVESNLIFMDDAGKTAMEQVIVSLKPLRSTNLWDGLKTGMDLLNDLSAKPVPEVDRTRVASIFLLTDGLANVRHPSGELQAFMTYLDAHPATFTVSTFGFGFGHALDSQLLLDLATIGGGQYSLIRHSGMGGIIVHAVANALATYAPTSTLAIEAKGQLSILGDIKHIKTSWGVQIDFGDIMYGQTRHVVVRAEDPMSVKVTASFSPIIDHEVVVLRGTAAPEQNSNTRADIKYHRRRLELVSALFDASKAAPDGEKILAFKTIARYIRDDPDLAYHKHARALLRDIEQQVLLILEHPEYWEKWGRYYLPSLARAHQRQRCIDFEGPGQRVYGAESPVFVTARNALYSAFDGRV